MTKIELIAETAAHNLQRMMRDGADEIESALIKAAEEAQLQEAEAKFTIAFAIKLNLDKGQMDNDLSWSVKHKLSVSDEIPNPDQLKLPIGGIDSMTIKTGNESVTITSEDAKKIQQACDRQLAKLRGKSE